MQIWRCEICGDPFLGEQRPSDCPFCGVPGRFISAQVNFSGQTGAVTGLTEVSRKNLENALKLEIEATKKYQSAAANAQHDEIRIFFKAISKHENEHVSLISKALGIPKPSIGQGDQPAAEKDNILETITLEDNATTLYAQFLSEATEPRVRQIFLALIAVEDEHRAKADQLLGTF